MKKYTLVDNTSGRDRRIQFTGDVLAEADSDDGKAQRWTELTLYHTSTGRYVLDSVGRSVVYHAAGSSCSKDARPTTAGKLLTEKDAADLIPCATCRPVALEEGSTLHGLPLLMERDRCTVTVAEKAQGIVDTLYLVDAVGVRRVSGLARLLMERATRADEAMASAWSLERV